MFSRFASISLKLEINIITFYFMTTYSHVSIFYTNTFIPLKNIEVFSAIFYCCRNYKSTPPLDPPALLCIVAPDNRYISPSLTHFGVVLFWRAGRGFTVFNRNKIQKLHHLKKHDLIFLNKLLLSIAPKKISYSKEIRM